MVYSQKYGFGDEGSQAESFSTICSGRAHRKPSNILPTPSSNQRGTTVTEINTKQNKEELLEMVAEVLQSNSANRNRTRTQRIRVSSGTRPRRTRTLQIKVSSHRNYNSSRNVSAVGFYPYDPSYLFCGAGSVPNYKKKRFARLRNRVSLIG